MGELVITSPKFGTHTVLYDDVDERLIKSYLWRPVQTKGSRTFYATTHANGRNLRMHRVILGEYDPKNKLDHINGNGIDNRRSNLRRCDSQQNSMNSQIYKNNRLGLKGVSKMKYGYKATISINREPIYLGFFKTPEEAANAYDSKAIELFGEFARLNFPT